MLTITSSDKFRPNYIFLKSLGQQHSTVKQKKKKVLLSIPGQLKMPVYHHHSPSGEFSLQFPQLILRSPEQDCGDKKNSRDVSRKVSTDASLM